MKQFLYLFLAFFSLHPSTTFAGDVKMSFDYSPQKDILTERPNGYPVATLAGGCFWCMESEFRRLEGVLYTESGYAGENDRHVLYEDVSQGDTGFREVIQVIFDPKKISYEQIIRHFMTQAHDPTQTDGQGVNIGPQYTSAIYTSDESQDKIVHDIFSDLTAKKEFKKPIVTKILPLKHYVRAEQYHQQYYEAYQQKTGQKHINIWIKEQKLRFK
jgi:peptide methionine sulfoxide reductase msrA/msrB